MIDAQTNPLLPGDFIVPSPYALLIIFIGTMLSYRLAALQAHSTFACTHFEQCAFLTSVCSATTSRVRNCGGNLQGAVILEVALQTVTLPPPSTRLRRQTNENHGCALTVMPNKRLRSDK